MSLGCQPPMRYAGDRRVGLLPRNRPATRRPLRIAGSSPQFGLISDWHLRLASPAFRLIALPLLRATLLIDPVVPGDRPAAMTLGRQTGLTGASTLYGCFVSAMRHSRQGRPGNGPRGSSNTDRFPPCVEQRRRSSPHRIKGNVKRRSALGRTEALSGHSYRAIFREPATAVGTTPTDAVRRSSRRSATGCGTP